MGIASLLDAEGGDVDERLRSLGLFGKAQGQGSEVPAGGGDVVGERLFSKFGAPGARRQFEGLRGIGVNPETRMFERREAPQDTPAGELPPIADRSEVIQQTLFGQLEEMKKRRGQSRIKSVGVGLDGAPIASQILMGR